MTRPPRPFADQRRPYFARRRPNRAREAGDALILYGLHTVELALKNPEREAIGLKATRNALARLTERFPAGLPLEAEIVPPEAIDRLLGSDAVHQGVALEVRPLEPLPLRKMGEARLILALDQVTDPHNVGAILRSAVALGVDVMLTTARHSAAESGVLAKAASGALDLLPLVQVRNLGDTLDELRGRGFTVIGLDSAGSDALETFALAPPVVLVLGAEDKGLRQRTRALCDIVARLDMPGPIKSLNVSNAAMLAIYIVRGKLGG